MYLSSSRQQTVEKSLFLNYFYKHCMHRLMAPLMAQTAGTKISRGIYVGLLHYSSLSVFFLPVFCAFPFYSHSYAHHANCSPYKILPAIFSSKYSLPIPSSISSCLAPWFVYAQMFPLPLPLPLPSLLPLFLFLSPCLPAQTRLRIQLCSPTFWTYSPCVLQDTPTLLGITSSTKMPSQGFSSSWPPLMHTSHLVCSIMTVVLVN